MGILTVPKEPAMTLCPIAIAAGCKKCPAFSVCPLKTVLGDHKPNETPGKSADPSSKPDRKG